MTVTVPAQFLLDGRVAVVTGATRGIGLAIARGLAEAGASVAIVSRDQDDCTTVANRLAAAGHRAMGCAAHLGDPSDLDRMVSEVARSYEGIDILVNNAATALSEPFGDISEAALNKAYEVNLRGPILLTQACAPYLRRSHKAAVVNVISAGAWMFLASVPAYVAMKAGLMAFTRSAAAALAADGVRVNALAPGIVNTEMRARSGQPFIDDLVDASLMRRPASPDEMAGPAVFLASDASSFMTGTVLHVDGGAVAS